MVYASNGSTFIRDKKVIFIAQSFSLFTPPPYKKTRSLDEGRGQKDGTLGNCYNYESAYAARWRNRRAYEKF
jgi:hypothetical protein